MCRQQSSKHPINDRALAIFMDMRVEVLRRRPARNTTLKGNEEDTVALSVRLGDFPQGPIEYRSGENSIWSKKSQKRYQSGSYR